MWNRLVAVAASGGLIMAGALALPAQARPAPASVTAMSKTLGATKVETKARPDWVALTLDESEAYGAADLPTDLTRALSRDVGATASEYLRNAEAAAAASDLTRKLQDARVKADEISVDNDGRIWVAVDTTSQRTKVLAAAAKVGAHQTSAVGLAKPDSAKPEAPIDPIMAPFARKVDVPVGGSAVLSDRWAMCTLGFWGLDESGTAVALTAGHCDRSGSQGVTSVPDAKPWTGSGTPENRFGKFIRSAYGNGSDIAVIKDTEAGAKPVARVKRWNGDQSIPIRGAIAPVVGAMVCKSGARTGWTCGTITAAPREFKLSDAGLPSVNGFSTSMCSGSGDSGSPVMSGNYAVGILSFGSFSIREGDGPSSCEMSAQVRRFLSEMLPLYPADQHKALRALMATHPEQMLLTGVHPLISDEGVSAFATLGSSFKLSAYVPTSTVSKAIVKKNGTTIRGKIALEGSRPSDYRIKVKVTGAAAVKPMLGPSGDFKARFPKVKKARKFQVRVQAIKSDRGQHPRVKLSVTSYKGKSVVKGKVKTASKR